MTPTIEAIARAALELCPLYGCDPQECIEQAIAISRNGAAAVRWNCWGLAKCGDGPDLLLTIGRPLPTTPYMQLVDQPISVFASPESAVRAWCRMRLRS